MDNSNIMFVFIPINPFMISAQLSSSSPKVGVHWMIGLSTISRFYQTYKPNWSYLGHLGIPGMCCSCPHLSYNQFVMTPAFFVHPLQQKRISGSKTYGLEWLQKWYAKGTNDAVACGSASCCGTAHSCACLGSRRITAAKRFSWRSTMTQPVMSCGDQPPRIRSDRDEQQ